MCNRRRLQHRLLATAFASRVANAPRPIPALDQQVHFRRIRTIPVFRIWLLSHAWQTTGSHFPPPYGILEDNFSVTGYACDLSYEYGDQACNNRGVSESPAPHDWETALGRFENSVQGNCPTTCFAFIGNGLTPGGGSNTGGCTNISGGHCYVTGEGGVVDDQDALDNLCAAADSSGHLRGIEAEETVFLKGNTTSGTPAYADTKTIVYMINTMSHLVSYTSGGCKNMVAIDIEASGGSFYPLNNYTPGTVSGGLPVRMEAAALRFLVPDPSTLVPDRMQPFFYTVGGTNNHWAPGSNNCSSMPYCEVPYFWEETMVPQGPEVPVGTFSWNGTTQSVGDGCFEGSPDGSGDTGGAVDLVATCVTDTTDPGAAVFRQEYHDLYVGGLDYGPAAILLNTSNGPVSISSTWFGCSGCDALSNFTVQVAISTGELQSVYYPGRPLPIQLPCTETTYCTGDPTIAGNTTSFSSGSPGSIGPHSGIILLGRN